MADALVSFVVDELDALVKDEMSLLLGVKKELIKLSNTFSAIQAVLEDAERQQVTNEGVRDWLGKIKEVAYEIEDILDEWRTADAFTSQQDNNDVCKIQKVHSCSLLPSSCFKQVKLRHTIGYRTREIRERLNEISKEKSDFKLKEINTRESKSRLNREERETSSFLDESEIFGRDEVKEEIIGQFDIETIQKEKSVSTVSIVGMGGLGKTTLAQLVYNDKRVKAYFENRIWVCVSDPFDVSRIAKKVIKSLDGFSPDNLDLDLDTLQQNLCKAVGKKLSLIVLDDVWDEDGTLWQKLRVPLKSAAPGSRIVVTTRSRLVAEKMETTHIHDLGVLPISNCWRLFKFIAFKGTEDEQCQELLEIGEKIVERCKGVPLAVRAVGSLLHPTREKWYWEHILESEIWEWDLCKDGGILPALLLSYYNLPPHLQRCLLFCTLFPKDHQIEKDVLVKLWMAHGIIKSEKVKNDHTEEIGAMYFEDLLTRSLFQDAEKDNYGNVVQCKMHDLIHDLATFVSSGDYCNMEAGNSELCSIKCHHLSLFVNFNMSSIPSLQCHVKRLYTLLLFGYSNIKAVPHSLFNPLRFLRALDLSGTSIENLPTFIGKLKHLRYLNLDGLHFRELPKSITNLFNLQTLKLNYCRNLCTLPSGMTKMVKLRHLEIKATFDLTVLPDGLGRLSSLRTLCKFPVGEENRGCKLGELKNLNLLKGELNIQNLERVMDVNDAREAELHKKSYLHVLSLSCEGKSDEELSTLGKDEMERMEQVLESLRPPHSNLKMLTIKNYAGPKFPSWLEDSKFSNLVHVVLDNCRKCELLPGLGKLHSLKYLKIIGAVQVKVVDSEFYGNFDAGVKGKGTVMFPKLEELYIQSMLNWEEWKLTEEHGGVMPSLKKLEIFRCEKLKALPTCLPSTLTKVEIRGCTRFVWAQDNPFPHLRHLALNCVRGMSSKPLPFPPALETLEIWGFSCESLPSDGWGLLESLHTLEICSCPELASLPGGLGELKALQTLHISTCWKLSSLPEELGQLKALQTLEISKCQQLSSLPDGLGLGQLHALRSIKIFGCHELTSLLKGSGRFKGLKQLDVHNCERLISLSDGLLQLEALQTLTVERCPNLLSLFDGFEQLISLRRLDIRYCPQLMPLPNLQCLTALEELLIRWCPNVTVRLEKERGEDWCKISHIPFIEIDWRIIQ